MTERPDVIVAGGSVAGLAAALALAGRGCRVVVLERGVAPPDGPPGVAGQSWRRPTVPSFPHAHTLTSLGVSVLLDRAPEVLAAALDAGAAMVDLTRAMPSERAAYEDNSQPRRRRHSSGLRDEPARCELSSVWTDEPRGLRAQEGRPHPPPHPTSRAREAPSGARQSNTELLALACRRPTLETVLYRVVRDLPDVEIRHGVRVGGLVLDTARGRVTGVVTDGSERIAAGLVLDATGRRALGRSWLAAHGITMRPDLTSPANMRGFSRFYHRVGATPALNRGNAAGVLGDHYAGVLHPGDGGTFSIAFGTLAEDQTMRVLREPAAFTAVARATPGIADWLAPGTSTPITGVRAITCPPNTMRTLALDPPVAGLVPLGDAAAITNPLYGRGVSLALAHAFRLSDLIAAGNPTGPAARLAAELVLPWFRLAVVDDEERIAHWRAAVHGWPPPRPRGLTMRTIARVADRDAVVWRGLVRVLMGLTHADTLFRDAAFVDRVRRLLATQVPPATTPSRRDLLAAVTRAMWRAS